MNFHTIYKNHSKKQLFPDERLQDLKSNKIFTAALHQNGSVSIIDANGETKNYFAENNSPIVQMSIGSFAHLLLLTQDQRVYSYFTNNSSFQGGNENKKTLSNGLYEIESLRNKKITQVLATQISSYCLSEDQDKSLYWWGYHPLRTSTGRPQIIAKNVDRIFGGCSWHMFFTKTDGSLYGDGYNTSSQVSPIPFQF
ncbi:ubiquitin-protein ligase e3a-related [Anaeramoeba flamelloides]|uniref:Ubiquitin-protein ligase e3a-related n=1 Tax=Anaeramoeba flamelloides TaxID=1746091 RepID=A0ABQ8YVF0_9EUKA|nr:ubiquitin-protein ligase e3a-related [Anaeramoeba flamelloides]